MPDSKARKRTNRANRYMQIIERIFLERYHDGAQEVSFERDDFVRHAKHGTRGTRRALNAHLGATRIEHGSLHRAVAPSNREGLKVESSNAGFC